MRHWWQEDDERKNTAMTGFLLFLLIVAAVVAGLESRHRRTIHEGYGAWASDPELLRDRRDGCGAARRIDAAGVADQPDALAHHLAQMRPQLLHEISGVAHLGLLCARGGEQRHRQLGEVVEHDEVERAVAQQLRQRDPKSELNPALSDGASPARAPEPEGVRTP